MPAPSTPPSLTTPPTAPSRDNAPATYITRMNAFLAWIATFVSEMGTMATALYNYATSAYNDAVATAADRVQTGLDRVQTGLDRAAVANDKTTVQNLAAGLSFTSTSTSTVTIGTGSKSWTVQANESYQNGMPIAAVVTGDPTRYMAGIVTSYSGTTLTIAVPAGGAGGSGSASSWDISIGGLIGPPGPGDVNGPSSATSNALAQYDGTTGKLIKNGPSLGTGANNVVQLDASARLPAVDGSQLTGISAGMTLLATVTASNNATVDIEGYFTSTYDEYLLLGDGISSTAGANLHMLLKVDGTYQTSDYNSAYTYQSSSSTSETAGNSTTEILLSGETWNTTTGLNGSVEARFYRPSEASTTKAVWARSLQPNTARVTLLTAFASYGSGVQSAITGVRFRFSSGNVSTGTFRLYGFKK